MKTGAVLISLAILFTLHRAPGEAQDRATSPSRPLSPHLRVHCTPADSGQDDDRLSFRVSVGNEGAAPARAVQLSFWFEQPVPGVEPPDDEPLGDLDPGQKRELIVSVDAPEKWQEPEITVQVRARDGDGNISSLALTRLISRNAGAPQLVLSAFLITPEEKSTALEPGDTAYVLVSIVNRGTRAARSLSLAMELEAEGEHLVRAGGERIQAVGDLQPMAEQRSVLTFLVKEGYQRDSVGVLLSAVEERPRYSVRQWVYFPVTAGMRYVRRAEQAVTAGDYEAASALISSALAANASLAAAYRVRALLEGRQGHALMSEADFRTAARLGDEPARAWVRLNRRSTLPQAVYRPVGTDPFRTRLGPIGLGILRFSTPDGEYSDLTRRLHRSLTADPAVRRRFILYSYLSLSEQKAAIGIESLDPSSEAVRRRLNEMEIRFVTYGVAEDSSGQSFRLRIIRTSDGETIHEERYRLSAGSDAIHDAVQFFGKGLKTVYRE